MSPLESCLLELERRLGPSTLDTSEAAREACAKDDSDMHGRLPAAVVRARDTADVRATLELCDAHGVAVTPRAAGTGRTGGAVPLEGGVVLDTSAMRGILGIERGDLYAVVQPGVVTGELHGAVEAEGLFYPPDPNSLASCMIGGNVAENAGGPRAFKYGVTREYVLGLETCLMGGRLIRSGRRTVKGVTGYDVTALLVGSEGTLGVFSEITLKLVHRPRAIATALALFNDVKRAAEAVGRVLARGLVPRCLELMDTLTLEAMKEQGFAVDPRAGALLLAELDDAGRGGASLDHELEVLGEALSGQGTIDVLVAQDGARRAALWEARRMLSPATRKLARHKLSEDVVVPRSKLPLLLDEVDRIGEATGVRYLTYGHAGDGNMHVNFLWDDPSERVAVGRAIERLMRATVALGGTLSGEHGIGISKRDYLHIEQSDALIDLQRDVKRVFDPRGLLNPGKIFPAARAGHRAC